LTLTLVFSRIEGWGEDVPRFEVRHFETPSGRDPIRAFLEELTSLERAACDEVIGFLERDELALHPRNSDYLGEGVVGAACCLRRSAVSISLFHGGPPGVSARGIREENAADATPTDPVGPEASP
jgi:hypothetical protein